MSSSLLSFSCGNCNKVYKRPSAYQKHYSICRLIRNKNVKNIGYMDEEGQWSEEGKDEFNDLSSLTKEEMGSILKEVLIKYQIIEKKMDELMSCVSMKKRKVNVIEWLNVNKKISETFATINDGVDVVIVCDFNQWIKRIKINRDCLDYVFKNSFAKLFSYIIQEYKDKEIPICAFTHKDGLLYVYNNEVCSWESMSEEQLANLVSIVSTQINTEFKLWQDEYKELILSDEKYHDIYLNNINKVFYTNYKTDSELSIKIKRELYNQLKINITI